MAADALLRFLRLNTMQPGALVDVLWNGRRASNGDGMPGVDPNAAPTILLNRGGSTPAWTDGKAGDGWEPDGMGIDGQPANPSQTGTGDGYEVDGHGEDGMFNSYWEWMVSQVLPTLRDGKYIFGVRMSDALGNIQTEPIATMAIIIRGQPRPPSNLRFSGYNAETGLLAAAWTASPDLE